MPMKENLINLLTTIKSKSAIFFGSVLALLSPIKYIMILVGVSIIIDTVFGVYTAKKLNKKISSRRLSSFISKMLVYQTVIITMYAIDVLLLGEFLLLFINIPLVATKVTALLLVINEAYSVDEKLRMLNPEKGLWFHFKRLLGIAKLIKKESEGLNE
jgi:hypothetical protein